MDNRNRTVFLVRHRLAALAAAVLACLLAGNPAEAQNRDQAQVENRDQAQSQKRDQAQSQHQGSDEAFTVKPESIAFGKRPLFASHTESFWVRGKGREPVRIASVDVQDGNENVFKVSNQCQGTLKMDEDCRIEVKFEPTTAGEKSAELRIVTGDGAVRTRQVTGTGVQAQYKVSAQSLQFGQVGRDDGSKEQKITITNTGPIALPVTSTSLSGPNEKQFAQSNDCPQELAPGRSCASTVVFRPTFKGQHQATLTIWAKGGAPETKVALRGTGT
jgi:hypothetical protein